MKVRELMTNKVIPVSLIETVEAAAQMLTHYNIGMLPVCRSDGSLCGVITDRDMVTRCIALGKMPKKTAVYEIMTQQVLSVQPEMQANVAAHFMGRQRVRRLPVVENGKLCGLLSLGDLARQEEGVMDAVDALADICRDISSEDIC